MIIQTLAELHFLSSSEPRRSFCASLPNCARCNCRYPMAVAFGQVAVTEQMVQPFSCLARPALGRYKPGTLWNFITWHETVENAMISSWLSKFRPGFVLSTSPWRSQGSTRDSLEASRLPHNHLAATKRNSKFLTLNVSCTNYMWNSHLN